MKIEDSINAHVNILQISTAFKSYLDMQPIIQCTRQNLMFSLFLRLVTFFRMEHTDNDYWLEGNSIRENKSS